MRQVDTRFRGLQLALHRGAGFCQFQCCALWAGFQGGDHLAFLDRIAALHLHRFDDGFDRAAKINLLPGLDKTIVVGNADRNWKHQDEQAGGRGKMRHFNV